MTDKAPDPIGDMRKAIERIRNQKSYGHVELHHPKCKLVTGKGDCNCIPHIQYGRE